MCSPRAYCGGPQYTVVHLDACGLRRERWQARPYVSPMSWALFQAYSVIISTSVFRVKQLQAGQPSVLDDASIIDVVRAALPEKSEFIDKFGIGSFHLLWSDLETKLLTEFASMLSGVDGDQATLEQAQRILDAVSKAELSSQT